VRGVAGRLEHSRERSKRGEKESISERRACGGVRSAVARPRGEKGREEGVLGVGVPRGARELVGSGPDRRVAPAATRARRGRATCAARARSVGDSAGERELTGGPAQLRAAVSLTGGVGLSAARGERGRGRKRAWAGPRGERNWAARLHSAVLELFELFSMSLN
jgi:hypothetical protein